MHTIPTEKPKGLWDDEDAEEEDVKESWEDEEDASTKVRNHLLLFSFSNLCIHDLLVFRKLYPFSFPRTSLKLATIVSIILAGFSTIFFI